MGGAHEDKRFLHMHVEAFHSLWDSAVHDHPHRPFLVFRDERGIVSEWTYDEFDDVVGRTAITLQRAGVGIGDAIQVVLRNSPAFVATWLATARLGACLVPVDPASTERDIRHQVERVRPKVGICAAARATTYRQGAGANVQFIIELAEDASDVAADGLLAAQPDSARELSLDALAAEVPPEQRLAVMFTSGTTSAPKGVVLTQANYANVAAAMSQAADLAAHHRWLVTLPLFHANAQYYCFAPAIAVGASVALTASFSASRWVAHARELEATHASLFAAPIRMILARCPQDEQPLTLEHVWFAQNLGEDHYAAFARLTGTAPRQLYGMTETLAVVCADLSGTPRANVIGTPLEGRTVRVEPLDDDDDNEHDDRAERGATSNVHVTTQGLLSVLGTPGVDLFAGYLDDEQTTRSVFESTSDGTWFRTGDVVAVNDDGTLRFVGRADDVIKVAGENVSLTDVEAKVAQAPGVLEAAVLARPDPIRDVVPVAYVVPKDPAAPPSSDDLNTWADDNLTPAARPREWIVIDELPRTSVGKIRRFQIAPRNETSTAMT